MCIYGAVCFYMSSGRQRSVLGRTKKRQIQDDGENGVSRHDNQGSYRRFLPFNKIKDRLFARLETIQ